MCIANHTPCSLQTTGLYVNILSCCHVQKLIPVGGSRTPQHSYASNLDLLVAEGVPLGPGRAPAEHEPELFAMTALASYGY